MDRLKCVEKKKKKSKQICLNLSWTLTLRKGITNGLKGKFVASWSLEWNSSMVKVEFCQRPQRGGETDWTRQSCNKDFRIVLNSPPALRQGCALSLQSRAICRCRTAAAWSGSASACKAAGRRTRAGAAGWTRKPWRTWPVHY